MAPRVVRVFASPLVEYLAAVLTVLRCIGPVVARGESSISLSTYNKKLLLSSGGLPANSIAGLDLCLGNIWHFFDDNVMLLQIHHTKFVEIVSSVGRLVAYLFVVMRTLVGDVHFLRFGTSAA